MAKEVTDSLSKAMEAIRRQDKLMKTVRSSLEPTSLAIKALQIDPGVQGLMQNLRRHGMLARAAFGPLEELRRSGILDQLSGLSDSAKLATQALSNYRLHFELPVISECAKLFKQFQESGITADLRRIHEQGRAIQAAMDSMSTPWLEIQNRLKSVGGFAELQSIGISLRTLGAFEEKLIGQLRINLGDWREPIKWPENIFTDAVARADFYADMGLDTRLTDFPADAFHQSVALAGLAAIRPRVVDKYDVDCAAIDNEGGFERTNAAHDLLQRFETNIRQFVDQQMTAAFGDGWIKQRVPGDIWKSWHEKRERARDMGERVWPLIAYADFTHYVPIIIRKDNWDAVFAPVFFRADSVTESFQRIYPIRIATMHARQITQDDELYLYVEAKRLLSAIGVAI
jgi:hypothetical protein